MQKNQVSKSASSKVFPANTQVTSAASFPKIGAPGMLGAWDLSPLPFPTNETVFAALREQKNLSNRQLFDLNGLGVENHERKAPSLGMYNEIDIPRMMAGNLSNLIGSINSSIVSASMMYSHCLANIEEVMRNTDKNDTERAMEKTSVLFRQLYGIENFIMNAKAELLRLESFAYNQSQLMQMPLDAMMGIEGLGGKEKNKRRFTDENLGEQPVKKKKNMS